MIYIKFLKQTINDYIVNNCDDPSPNLENYDINLDKDDI